MYGWIWRKLPGHWALKTLESVVLALLVAGVLVVVVFPWVEPKLPFSGNTVSGETDGATTDVTQTPTPTASPTDVPEPQPSDDGGNVLPGD